MTAAPEPVRLDRLPMAEDRTAACSFLRAAGPVLRTAFGSYLITSAEAAEFALRNPGLFSSRRAFDLVGSPLPLVPIAFDPPEHARYRRILQPFFSPRGVAAWLPQVRVLARELIDGVAQRGHCDLVADLAVPLPAQVFLTLFGLPVQDRDRLNTWKEALVRIKPGQPGETRGEHAVRMGTELFEYLVEHVTQRRRDG
jgi:cytochrome P450